MGYYAAPITAYVRENTDQNIAGSVYKLHFDVTSLILNLKYDVTWRLVEDYLQSIVFRHKN